MHRNKEIKIHTFKPGKYALARAEMRRARHEFERLTQMLTDPGQWLALEKAHLPDLDLPGFAERLLKERQQAASRMQELKGILSGIGSEAPPGTKASRRLDIPGFPPDFPDPRDPRLWEYIYYMRLVESLRSFPHKFSLFTEGACAPQQGLATLSAVHDSEVVGPYSEGTMVETGFTNSEVLECLQVTFIDNSIHSPSYGDSFTARRILDFEFPAAPCEGTLNCSYGGCLTISPKIMATHGNVRAEARSLLHIEGDSIDPLDDSLFWYLLAEVSEYVNASIGDWGDPFPIIDSFSDSQSIEVQSGDTAVLHISVENYMYVYQGRADFIGDGLPYYATLQICNQPWVESDEIGVWWQFEPSNTTNTG